MPKTIYIVSKMQNSMMYAPIDSYEVESDAIARVAALNTMSGNNAHVYSKVDFQEYTPKAFAISFDLKRFEWTWRVTKPRQGQITGEFADVEHPTHEADPGELYFASVVADSSEEAMAKCQAYLLRLVIWGKV